MVSRVFERVLRFFGTIAAGLTGLGALCTAAGFLAERTRWSMLGFGGAPVDLNEYLFTGARFLAFLPGIALTSVLTAAAESLTALMIALAVVAALVVVRRRARFSARSGRAEAWLSRLRSPALVALALVQFVGTLVLFQAARLRNVLFADRAEWAGAECGRAAVSLETEVALGCEEELTAHLGRVFLIVLASAGALWLLASVSVRSAATRSAAAAAPGEDPGAVPKPQPAALLGLNLGLLVIQVVLLPVNYGALFLRNDFPLVEVTLARPELRAERWPADGRFSLLHRRDDEFYLYASSARRIWLVPRDDVETLTYLGICAVFDPAERCRPDDPPVHSFEGVP